jgi:O-antigen/teichoic acid export membrane protein
MPALTQARSESGERRALYVDSLAQALCVGVPIAVGGALCASGLIELVFGASYEPSAMPLTVLLASIPFLLWKDVAMVGMVVAGKEKAVLRMTIAAVLFNLVANLLVIPRWGMVGAAATTLATEVLRAVLGAWYVRGLGLPLLGVARLWRTVLSASAMAVALLAIPTPRVTLLGVTLPEVLLRVVAGAFVYALTLAALGGVEWRRGALPRLRV